jgi:hypothetical protein
MRRRIQDLQIWISCQGRRLRRPCPPPLLLVWILLWAVVRVRWCSSTWACWRPASISAVRCALVRVHPPPVQHAARVSLQLRSPLRDGHRRHAQGTIVRILKPPPGRRQRAPRLVAHAGGASRAPRLAPGAHFSQAWTPFGTVAPRPRLSCQVLC